MDWNSWLSTLLIAPGGEPQNLSGAECPGASPLPYLQPGYALLAKGDPTMRGLRRACMHLIVLGLMILWHGQAAVAAPLGSLVQAAGLRDIGEPQQAVDFQLSDLDGQLLRLQDQRGKVVLLNFWATWCHPCLQEMPLMEQLYQTLRQRPFVMWAVAMKEDREKVAPFMDKHHFQFTALLDRDGAVSTRYKLRGLPTTYLIDCHGNTVGWSVGPQEWTSEAIRTLLAALLSDPSCG
jgi:peroxiredoxin